MKQFINTYGKSGIGRLTWFELLRVAVGIVLIWKAANFLRDTAVLESLLSYNMVGETAKSDATLIVILSAITFIAGFFIMIGRYTPIASFIQLPVFLIGTLFIHAGQIERDGLELALTIIVPFLLLFFIGKDDAFLHAGNSKRHYKKKRVYFISS